MTTGVRTATDLIAKFKLPVEVVRREGLPRERKVWSVVGTSPERSITAHNNDEPNLLRGLVERLYLVQGAQGFEPTPRPLPGLFAARLRGFRLQLRKHLPLSAPVSVDTFLDYYAGKQRKVYEKAAASLETDPVRAGDARVQTFVKAEKIDLRSKPDPVPRLIQPRSPRYNVEVGRYLRPIEKLVYRGIAKVWGGPTVLKCNAAEQAAALREMWDSFDDPVAVGLDASRFDQHVSRDALEWEHSIYAGMFVGRDRDELERLLSWQLRNVGRAYLPTAVVKYEVEGARMSGDINTSLGNCLIMCGMVWEYCHQLGIRARLANNGDDCIVVLNRRDLAAFSTGLDEWFRQMGFTMVAEAPVEEFELIEFCQTKPVWMPEGWLMVRTLDRAFGRDLSSLLDLGTGLKAYFGAVGACGLAAYGGVPVFQELYQLMVAAGRRTNALGHATMSGGLFHLSKGMSRGYGPVSERTRYSFAVSFGILPAEQIALEDHLRRAPLDGTLMQTLTPFVEHWYR